MAIDENEAPVAPIEESGETVTYGASAEDIQKAQEAGWNDQVAINEAEDAREDVEWAGEGKVYAVEWKDEFGDVGPEIPELEQMLFATTLRNTKGEFFDNLVFEAQIEGPENLRINKVSDPYTLTQFALFNVR